jgi:hypothetical protein
MRESPSKRYFCLTDADNTRANTLKTTQQTSGSIAYIAAAGPPASGNDAKLTRIRKAPRDPFV